MMAYDRQAAVDVLRNTVVHVAQDEISPLTVKGSQRVRDYWRAVGPEHYTASQIAYAAEHSAWCGIFAMWCLHHSGLVPNGVRWKVGGGFARENDLPTTRTPAPGDVVIFGPPLWHHAIYWSGPDDQNRLLTIDGNAGLTGDVRACRRPWLHSVVAYSIQPWIDRVLDG